MQAAGGIKEWKKRATIMVPLVFITTMIFGFSTLPWVLLFIAAFYSLELLVLWLLTITGFFHPFPNKRSEKGRITD